MTDLRLQRILVVDDEESVLAFLCVALDHEGYSVQTAATGKEALSRSQEDSFDAALVDLVLPDINGLEVIRKLKELQPEIVILIVTGYPDMDSAMEAIALKVDGYLTKPCSRVHLLASLHNALTNRDVQRENLQLRLEAERARQLTDFYKATQALISRIDRRNALDQMLQLVAEALKADAATLRVLEADRQNLRLAASCGLDLAYHEKKAVVALRDSVVGRVVQEIKTAAVSDLANGGSPLLPPDLPIPPGLRSLLSAPVLWDGEVIGGIAIYWKSPHAISTEDKRQLYAFTNQVAAVFYNRQLLEDLDRTNKRLQEELSLAGEIQQELTPRDLATPRVAIAGYLQPASMLAGDVYSFFHVDDHRVVVYIGDVADQGCAAAFSMMVLRHLLDQFGHANLTPAEVLRQTNLSLKAFLPKGSGEPMILATACFGILDLRTGVFRYAKAAHECPILWKHRSRTCEELQGDGLFLGIFNEGDYEDREVTLEAGDMMVLYTDGLVEALDPHGNRFTRARMRQLIADTGHLAPTTFARAIRTQMAQFTQGTPFQDDQALVAVRLARVNGEQPPINLSDPLVVFQEVPGALQSIPSVISSVLEAARRKKFTGKLFPLRLALDEALQNAVKHGCGGDAGRQVWVRAVVEESRVEIRVGDEGNGFEFEDFLPPCQLAAMQPLRPAGRGLQIIHNCVDELEFRGRGNELRMVFLGA